MGCFSSSKSESKVRDNLNSGQKALLNKLTGMMKDQLGQGVAPYSGQRVAPVSGLEQQGLDWMDKLFPTANNMTNFNPQQGQQFLNQGGEALDTMLQDYDPAGAQDYWNKSVKQPAMQTWQRDIVPQIMEKYAGQNATDSGAMRRAIARSGADMNTDLNAQLANIIFGDRQSHLGRQQQGINQSMNMATMPGNLQAQQGQMAGMGADLVGQAMNAGGFQRGLEQFGLDTALNQWQQQQPYNNPWLKQMPIALGTPAYQFTTEKSGPGMGYAMFGNRDTGGAAASGTMAALAALSDINEKENIEPISVLEKLKELKPYTYNYKGSSEQRIGLIAQDVEKVFPKAVLVIDGKKHVDIYALISILIGAVSEMGDI